MIAIVKVLLMGSMFHQLLQDRELPLGPIIQVTEGEPHLFVDKKEVCKCSSVLQSVALVFVAYWLFNIKYRRKASSTLTFIERGLLGLNVTKPKAKCFDLLTFFQFHAK